MRHPTPLQNRIHRRVRTGGLQVAFLVCVLAALSACAIFGEDTTAKLLALAFSVVAVVTAFDIKKTFEDIGRHV